MERNIYKIGKELFITDDSEINIGWIYNSKENIVEKAETFEDVKFLREINSYEKIIFKVILTTDESLIADGIQAIDDDFLQWFIAHPSCEEVEVKLRYMPPYRKETHRGIKYDVSTTAYKIIIPSEEFKPKKCEHEFVVKFGVSECQICGELESELSKETTSWLNNKRETKKHIVEIMEQDEKMGNYEETCPTCGTECTIGGKTTHYYIPRNLYSEEEVDIMFDILKKNSVDNKITITNVDLFIKSWKEEFKKK